MPHPSSMPRPVSVLLALAASASLVCATHATPARAPLEGRDLAPADEVRSGLESVAGSLLGGELKGRVTRAVVDEDAPRRLSVRVSHVGLQGARLWGELLDASRRRQSGIVMGEPVSIGEAEGELVLSFEAEPGAQPAVSAMLRISVAAPGRRTASSMRVFRLGKEWSQPALAGADFSVTVSPLPIGRTAELGATPSTVVPTSVVRIAPPPTAAPPPAAGAMIRMVQPSAATRSVIGTATPPSTAASGAVARALPAQRVIHPLQPGTGPSPTAGSRAPRGPAALPLPTFADVRTEDIRLDLTSVLNVHPEVYPDLEPASGIFYFLPHEYALRWDAVTGYEFRSVYSAATAGAAGEVLMSATLDGGIGPRDLALASQLVQSYVQARGMVFRELRPLPVDSLAISIADDLGRYAIRQDRIAVSGLTDVAGRFDISWVTDERTKDFIQQALVENVGIHGSVTYAPTGRALGPRTVPIRILLGSSSTFGPFGWDRTGWKNPTPYPITLRHLHALRTAPGAPPTVHSWSLRETRVPPGGQVRWSAAAVPFWIDAQAKKLWIDYTVDASCGECGTSALAALTGGVSTAGSSHITFHVMTPLAETGAHRLVIDVRSRYFDAQAGPPRMQSLIVDADGKDYTVGPLLGFARWNERAGPLFEFRVSLARASGEVVAGDAAWVAGSQLWQPLARRQLEQSLGAAAGR